MLNTITLTPIKISFVSCTGNQCDIDVDGCANDPCPLLTTCNDKTPADQATNKVLYSCSNCPTGYRMHNGKCTGRLNVFLITYGASMTVHIVVEITSVCGFVLCTVSLLITSIPLVLMMEALKTKTFKIF